jgi:hypothetical protein
LQLRYDYQPLPNNHDSDEENEKNFRVREKSLPLCFSSFQFLKRNSRQVVNSEDNLFYDELVEDVINDMGSILDPKSQSLFFLDFQSPRARNKI